MLQIKEKWINEFVSHGPTVEYQGQQVRPDTRTSIAIGKVFALEEKGNDNLRLVLKVSGAKYDFTGFINDNNPVANLLKQAKEKDTPIAVRFEKKRKKNVSPATPIEELTKDSGTARDSIVNIVAGVYNFNDKSWILTDDAVSNPDEDPEYVNQELDKAAFNVSNFFGSSSKPIQHTADEKANHLMSMYGYANELNLEHDLGLDIEGVKMLSSYLLKAADTLQMAVYGLNSPNYRDYSHTKARGILFSWIRVNPLSREIMSSNFNGWLKQFLDESTHVWKWAIQSSMPDDVSNQ